jgi:hypothetical protein
MSTAVATVGPRAVVVDWTRELDGARMLMKSGLLPKEIKSPEAALFIILAGRDLGLSAVQSLRSIYVIQGKIEVAADMQLGLFHRAGGKSQWAALTNDRAVLILHAPWLVEPHTETFSLDDAKRAKLGGENWLKWPKAMLRSRAITAGLKSVGFDPTSGAYDYGELGGPEATIVEEPETVEPEPGMDERLDDSEESEESQAVAEIDALLPTLALNQQEYVREQLSTGADPIKLLERMLEKVRAAS